MLRPALALGYCVASWRAMVASSACACASVTAGTFAPDHLDAGMHLTIPHGRLRVLAERREDFGIAAQAESARCDAYDGIGHTLKDEPRAGRAAAAEAALPEAITDDGYGRAAGTVFIRQKGAAAYERNSQNGKKASRDLAA